LTVNIVLPVRDDLLIPPNLKLMKNATILYQQRYDKFLILQKGGQNLKNCGHWSLVTGH